MWCHKDIRIHFPKVDQIEQGQEFVWVERNGSREKIRFHDYDRIYEIPGLYEHMFYDRYHCNSPEVVCSLLKEHLDECTEGDDGLCVLDIGAGNGMVGEQLVELGAESVVGIDIIEAAVEALDRDRPDLYEDYHVADLTRLPESVERSLKDQNFNCMTVVAALGFDDIPPLAFANGYNLVSAPGWVAFNIKEDFVCEADSTGFCQLIEQMIDADVMEVQERRRYRHRFCQDGTPLYYYAVVGQKLQDIPGEMLTEFAG
jgi:predicted TPR repeat methyltransferase